MCVCLAVSVRNRPLTQRAGGKRKRVRVSKDACRDAGKARMRQIDDDRTSIGDASLGLCSGAPSAHEHARACTLPFRPKGWSYHGVMEGSEWVLLVCDPGLRRPLAMRIDRRSSTSEPFLPTLLAKTCIICRRRGSGIFPTIVRWVMRLVRHT